MRVICLVPSLTETLIECGINVVGRTRFCLHPVDQVKSIPKVGGTKAVDWDRCASLKPDIVVFDREENLKSMADECPYSWIATHITSVDNVGTELLMLAAKLKSTELQCHAEHWIELASKPKLDFLGWHNIPGELDVLNNTHCDYQHIEYIIWRKPWMGIGQNTFINSMLTTLGFVDHLPNHAKPYPELEQRSMVREDTFYLFSSEPYPFVRHKETLIEQGFNGVIVDGEVYSWYGLRSYRNLFKLLNEVT